MTDCGKGCPQIPTREKSPSVEQRLLESAGSPAQARRAWDLQEASGCLCGRTLGSGPLLRAQRCGLSSVVPGMTGAAVQSILRGGVQPVFRHQRAASAHAEKRAGPERLIPRGCGEGRQLFPPTEPPDLLI